MYQMSDFEKRINRVQNEDIEAQQSKLEKNRQLELKAFAIGREVTDYLVKNHIEPKAYWAEEVIGQVYEPAHMAKSDIWGDRWEKERTYNRRAYVKKGEAWHIYTQIMADGNEYEYDRGGVSTESRLLKFEDKSYWLKDDGSKLSSDDLAMKTLQMNLETSIKVMQSDLFARAVNHLVQTGEPYRTLDFLDSPSNIGL